MVTKKDIVSEVSAELGITKVEANRTFDTIFKTIMDYVSDGEKVQIIGFGGWEARYRSARNGRNPQTGEPIRIEEGFTPVFKPGKAFKEQVNK